MSYYLSTLLEEDRNANQVVDSIGIGTTSGGYELNVSGTGFFDTLGVTNDLTVDTNTLYVDSADNRVGIVNLDPQYELDVSGDINTSGVYRVDGTEVLSETGITLSSGDITVNNLTVSGDTTINGTLTTINSTTVQIEDNLLKLSIGNIADTVDSGFYSLYNDGTSKYSGIFRDATDDTFKFFTGLQDEPTSTVNTGGTGYSLADLDVNNLNITGYYTKDNINATPYILLQDQKPSGTNGGNFEQDDWRTRDLNTKVIDTHNLCTLSSNQITLPSGTYRIKAKCPAWLVAANKAKLRNITDSSDEIIGLTARNNGCFNYAKIHGQFTITSTKTFEIQHRCSFTRPEGFGLNANFGVIEIYSQVEIWRLY
jgi:hypothetical protein